MRNLLVVISEYHLNLYRAGFLDYAKQKGITIDYFMLDNKDNYNVFYRKMLKYNILNSKSKLYANKKVEFSRKIKKYSECLFINLPEESQSLVQLLPPKIEKSILFVDTMKTLVDINKLREFKNIYSFEYGDVEYAKHNWNMKVNYIPIGTSYHLYNLIDRTPRDISFVCLATKKRLEYLDKIANYCQKNNRTLFLAGHFWHNNNFWQNFIGKIKFKNRYPVLYKYIKNEYLKPHELAQVYADSKICLNINIEKHHSFNERCFDIMVLKRLLITDEEDLNGINIISDKEFLMSRNIEDMIKKIDIYLDDDNARERIALNGKLKVEKYYCFTNAMDEIFK